MLGKPVANIVIIMVIDGYHDAAGCRKNFLPREEIENIFERVSSHADLCVGLWIHTFNHMYTYMKR